MKFIALMALFVCAGCATVTTARQFQNVNVENGEQPIETVVVENTAWKLFNFIPIASGNVKMPNKVTYVLFADSTTLQNNLDMLEGEMKRVGATRIVNLRSKDIDESVFIMFLTRTTCQTSAVLLK
ncbi:MAG: hypothetical protein J6R18_06485 [Kiritimatiellae bacterium]|nr:hypothetical protein [Kiritimatiellia bacterium]